jgi:hypothetical protein
MHMYAGTRWQKHWAGQNYRQGPHNTVQQVHTVLSLCIFMLQDLFVQSASSFSEEWASARKYSGIFSLLLARIQRRMSKCQKIFRHILITSRIRTCQLVALKTGLSSLNKRP